MRVLLIDKLAIPHIIAGIEEELQEKILNYRTSSGTIQICALTFWARSLQHLGNSKVLLANANNYILQYPTHLQYPKVARNSIWPSLRHANFIIMVSFPEQYNLHDLDLVKCQAWVTQSSEGAGALSIVAKVWLYFFWVHTIVTPRIRKTTSIHSLNKQELNSFFYSRHLYSDAILGAEDIIMMIIVRIFPAWKFIFNRNGKAKLSSDHWFYEKMFLPGYGNHPH